MKFTFHTYYKVSETVDEFGRIGAIVGYFRTESDAKIAAKGRGWFGGDGQIESVPVIQIDDQFYELAQREPVTVDVDLIKTKKQREAAVLAKLSAEDLAVLRTLGLRTP